MSGSSKMQILMPLHISEENGVEESTAILSKLHHFDKRHYKIWILLEPLEHT